MTRIIIHSKGDATVEDMNNLANYLLKTGLAKLDTYGDGEECGFQEGSYALCDFEVHVVKKRNTR